MSVTRDQAIRFLEGAFRNIKLPPLSSADIEDVRDGLSHFGSKCSCMEIAGEDPNCIKHGRGTMWSKENPDLCAIFERIDDLVETLRSIADHTDADNPDSYRADDREGCLDTVHVIAARAVDRALNGGAA